MGSYSHQMSLVRQKNTSPELAVRKLIFSLGYRYRLNKRGLPGTPDLVFSGRRKVIFVHGCFWHHHAGCKLATVPKTRTEFWQAKFEANRTRDNNAITALYKQGWEVLVIWQCEIKYAKTLEERIRVFLDNRKSIRD